MPNSKFPPQSENFSEIFSDPTPVFTILSSANTKTPNSKNKAAKSPPLQKSKPPKKISKKFLIPSPVAKFRAATVFTTLNFNDRVRLWRNVLDPFLRKMTEL